jgi:hypothetical protein
MIRLPSHTRPEVMTPEYMGILPESFPGFDA